MRYLIPLLLILSGCATPMQVCMEALHNGDTFTMFEDGKPFRCEKKGPHEKANPGSYELVNPRGLQPEQGSSEEIDMPDGGC